MDDEEKKFHIDLSNKEKGFHIDLARIGMRLSIVTSLGVAIIGAGLAIIVDNHLMLGIIFITIGEMIVILYVINTRQKISDLKKSS